MPALAAPPAQKLKKLNYRHKAVMDWMLANPDRGLGDCSRELGYTQSWLSQIVNSDLFRDEFARRRSGIEEHENREIVGKLRRMAKGSLDVMTRRIEASARGEEEDGASDQLLLEGSKAALKALGYGAPQRTTHVNQNFGQQQINNGAVDEATLREAREIYRRSHASRYAPADAPALPASGGGAGE